MPMPTLTETSHATHATEPPAPPVYISGFGNDRLNLGNALHISEAYVKDLDMDRDQDTPPPLAPLMHLFANQASYRARFLTVRGAPPADCPRTARIFDRAVKTVNAIFAEKKIHVDLVEGCCEDDFTAEILVDDASDNVMAVAEFVFMRKYLWIECFAVSKSLQRAGIGKLLMERMLQIAHTRRKNILLYALDDVVPFYQSLGFVFSSTYLPKPWHIGRFMVLPLFSSE
ncbi:hypothetical protein HK105_208861 [Polyrhizophydium stewartii]|uniref:Glucosamine 6-phosphate N-acetyltransferase n=1 Tax=Polyrhizophydium stewartii TaxID=2732419 RepID=A0ABR4MWL1_9FUNG